ncbi:unannotated protein [freshwater metagenome]|uniref:Unannotated protein n=1 Tax=freshwater metagenome TaxID=449393 RepID=A0A6J7ITD6_9ZZZZ
MQYAALGTPPVLSPQNRMPDPSSSDASHEVNVETGVNEPLNRAGYCSAQNCWMSSIALVAKMSESVPSAFSTAMVESGTPGRGPLGPLVTGRPATVNGFS